MALITREELAGYMAGAAPQAPAAAIHANARRAILRYVRPEDMDAAISILGPEPEAQLHCEAQEVDAWQPMETAPMDGSDILIWTIHGEADVAWWDGSGWCAGKREDGASYYPGTHVWQQLPVRPFNR